MKNIQPQLTIGEATAVNAVREHLKRSLRGANLARAMEVFEGGVENANDTVFLEKAQPRTEWLNMFVGSMACLLADMTPRSVFTAEDRKAAKRAQRVIEVFAEIKVRG